MAHTKEGVIVILDVTKSTREFSSKDKKSFFDKQKECCIQFLQKKIFYGKKDEIAFLLMGTESTDNELNRNLDLDGYENITEGIEMQIPNWNMLTTLINSINSVEGSESVDWVDAIVVALDILRREEAKRFKYLKIVLFHQFMYPVDDSSTDTIIQRLKDINVELIIINDHVMYKDAPSTKIIKSFFSSHPDKSGDQLISENVARKIIEETDSVLCNFDIAVQRIIQGIKPKGRPWFWYSTLDIGSKIKIHVGVTISIKKEEPFKFVTTCAQPNRVCWRQTEYFQNGEKVKDTANLQLTEELIHGYMLGATPIPYPEVSLPETKKCMQCIGFTQRSNILPQYLLGDGTYLVFAKPTMEMSEKMMLSLVQSLHKNNMVMIGLRVFRDGLRPKFIALFPNMEEECPCLTLFELFCAEQQVFMHFPMLRTKKTEPTTEQYDAIESLMNAMNLDDDANSNGGIRDQYEKDLIPLKSLPDVTHEYICHVATERIIEEAKEITVTLHGRDDILNVPETIYKKSKEPLKKIKEIFPLTEVKKEIKKELIRHCGNIDSHEADNDVEIDTKPLEYKTLISVGTVTPAEDFKTLIKNEVEVIDSDKMDEKIPVFDRLTKQIQEVLKDLIFKTITLQYEKIVESLKLYRDEATQYNPYDFNDFIREIKAIAISRKMYEFWEEVIVKNELGLLSSKDCYFFNEKDDVTDVDEFYKIEVEKALEVTDVGSIDELFDDM